MRLKFSIIMNCYNGQDFLKDSLLSVINQRYKNWELIFWDNNSSDNSKIIFNKFKEKKFKYFFSKKKEELYIARNRAIKKATGDIITFLDVDDIWLKNKLWLQVKKFKDKNVNLVYGNYIIKNENNLFKKKYNFNLKKLPEGFITNFLLKNYLVGLGTLAIRKKKFKKKNIFNSKISLISDFDFVLKFSLKNKIVAVQSPILIYRNHSKQHQRQFILKQADQFIEWFKKNKKNFYKFENFKFLNKKYYFYLIIKSIFEKTFFENFIKILQFSSLRFKIKMLTILIFKSLAIKYFIRL